MKKKKFDFDSLKAAVKEMESRRERASERLEEVGEPGFYFAFVGISFADSDYSLDSNLAIRAIEESPVLSELVSAVQSPFISAAISRYSHRMLHELFSEISDDDEHAAFDAGLDVIFMLRIATDAEFMVPFISTVPWSTLAAFESQEIMVIPFEDYPMAFPLKKPQTIKRSTLDWVKSNLNLFRNFRQNPSYNFACEAIAEFRHQTDPRMAAVNLWAGIEALFGISHELRFRLSAYIATSLEPRGPSRFELYKKVRSLYDTRSKAVHGSDISKDALKEHVSQVRALLSSLLIKCLDEGKIITRDVVEENLFC